jgi:hypothetical protein
MTTDPFSIDRERDLAWLRSHAPWMISPDTEAAQQELRDTIVASLDLQRTPLTQPPSGVDPINLRGHRASTKVLRSGTRVERF